jgi:hypothetical protein
LGAKAAHKMLVTLTPGRKVTTKNLQLVGIASLLIASKYEEILTPSIGECSCREYWRGITVPLTSCLTGLD